MPSTPGGLPPQTALHTQRATFTEAYAVLPRATMSDITASRLPGWTQTRAWVLARPMTGFAETFSQYLMEVQPGGGSTAPEPDPTAQGVIFLTHGAVTLTIDGTPHTLTPGGYAYLPPGCPWTLLATQTAIFHWIRKSYVPAQGIAPPAPLVTSDQATAPRVMPDSNFVWATTLFTDPADLAHDMAVTIVTLQPGGVIPFEETHVMEHGLYVLEGKAVYRLNRDWVEVEAGDFMWLRAFCPQACYAGGPGPFQYLLYKDINRHMPLRPMG